MKNCSLDKGDHRSKLLEYDPGSPKGDTLNFFTDIQGRINSLVGQGTEVWV